LTELRELGGEVAAIELTADERADDLGPKECDGLGVVARRDGCIHGSSCAERRAEQTTSVAGVNYIHPLTSITSPHRVRP